LELFTGDGVEGGSKEEIEEDDDLLDIIEKSGELIQPDEEMDDTPQTSTPSGLEEAVVVE
jgi:hypothetical protein